MAKSAGSTLFKVIVALVLVGGIASGAYFYLQKRGDDQPDLVTTPITRGDVIQSVTATGDLQPVTSVDVSSQISGQIREMTVDFNTKVTKGQILARLDPATYESRLRQAEADLASTTANSTLVRLNTQRSRELKEKNLVSQADLDQAEAQLKQADAQLQTRQAAVENAKVDLSRCTLYAPIDGIVMDRQCEVGKMVAASLNAPTLFTIVNDLSKMQINAAVAEADIGSVAVDQQVTFRVDAFPTREFRGRISQIRNAPKANQSVVTYQTIIDVTNEDLKLKPGMTANVTIVVAQRSGSLRVSNGALRARIPEEVLAARQAPAKPVETASVDGTPKPAAKPMTDEERRAARMEIMREAGWTRESGGPPSPEVLAKATEIAKARGIDIDFSRGFGGGRGGGRNSGGEGAVTSRPAFRLVGTDPKTGKIESITLKLGVTDGIYTEVLDGAKEGDVLVTGVVVAGAAAAPNAASNPFGGGNRFGGGGGGGAGGGGGGRGR